ncbi:PREDICTED: uncharacterized protein LOC109156542 [Ipomoea nil]|uniref:uncharacterized protein LOC109156542 n=1 Tax=Ipomoea nil TaxID=35883 RepID=UPI00090138E6|nr:PREDICTED: uncharacterized protein LOC109156542 [Ipomoea nil]
MTRRRQPQKDNLPYHKKYLFVRTTLKKLYSLVSSLTPEQHQAVRDIGFGLLLGIILTSYDGNLLRYLLERMDIGRCSIHLQEDELFLDKDDVQSTLGVPRGHVPIVEGVSANETDAFTKLVADWRERWGIEKGTPSTSQMLNGIVEGRSRGFVQTRFCNLCCFHPDQRCMNWQ